MHKISWTGPRLFVMVSPTDCPIYEHSFISQKDSAYMAQVRERESRVLPVLPPYGTGEESGSRWRSSENSAQVGERVGRWLWSR
jgi:hypothetical protein